MIFLYDGINIEGNGGFNPSATFTSDPYPLLDVISCTVTEERNGQFAVVMQYPIGAQYADKIKPDAVIMAQPRPNADVEPFRIYQIEQVISGVVTARANHLVYDLDGLTVGLPASRFSGLQGISSILSELESAGQFIIRCFALENDGIVDTTTELDFKDEKFVTIWKIIGMIASAFNAEMKYTWDTSTNRCTISFCAARGTVKPTIISYGVNLIGLNRKLDYSELYSRVVAVWFNPDPDGFPPMAQGYVSTSYTGRVRSLWIDATEQFQTLPTTEELEAVAQSYVDSHDFNPLSDLTVEFVPTSNTTQYSTGLARVGTATVGFAHIGTIVDNSILLLCDTATVDASLIGVTATAKCVKVVYNVITDKYDNVTVGTIQNDIVDTILKLEG